MHAIALSGSSPAPAPLPAIDLQRCRSDDRDELARLKSYVDELTAWLRRGDHQALRVSWQQVL